MSAAKGKQARRASGGNTENVTIEIRSSLSIASVCSERQDDVRESLQCADTEDYF